MFVSGRIQQPEATRIIRLFGGLLTELILVTLPLSAQDTYNGYTFVFSGKSAQLYDMDKSVINEWTTQYNIEGCGDLLRDSSIIVPVYELSGWEEKKMALTSGRFMIYNWQGKVTWDFKYCSIDYCPHHDIEPVYRTNDPKEKPTFLIPCYTKTWGDKIVEIRPTGKNTGEVIWEWVASDHLCQSGCTDKANLLDKSKGGKGSFNMTSDAMHVNNLSYNRKLDQIVFSNKGFNELMVIDHSTTTAEAKGTTGGKYKKGGGILYRWGCPSNYGAPGTRQFDGQHACCWVPDTMPGTNLPITGAGNFMAVNNGGRKVFEFACPGLKNGIYERAAGKAFEPTSTLWSYSPGGLASNEGSIQKMPNGNYIICTGGVGMSGGFSKRTIGGESIIYEVNSSGTIVWQLSDFGTSSEGYRYAYGYLGVKVDAQRQSRRVASSKMRINAFLKRPDGTVRVSVSNASNGTRLSLFTLAGREMAQSSVPAGDGVWELDEILQAGTYIAKVTAGTAVDSRTITVQR